MTDPKLTPREPSEAERLAQALTDWKSREVRDLDRLDAAAELRRLAALSESNAIDALNYESRIERLQAENDALRAMHDAAPSVEAEPVAWISTLQERGHDYGKKRLDWVPIQSLQPGLYAHTPLYTHPAAPQPAALPELSETRGIRLLYEELVFAVGNKHHGETRHQTALRYIQQAETSSVSSAAKAALKGEQ